MWVLFTGINDGAAAMVLMRADEAAKRSLNPLARVVAWSHVGVDPAVMGIAPVDAIRTVVSESLSFTLAMFGSDQTNMHSRSSLFGSDQTNMHSRSTLFCSDQTNIHSRSTLFGSDQAFTYHAILPIT